MKKNIGMETETKREQGLFPLFRRLEQVAIVRAIRNGLVNMIPILIIGAFALILKTFPVEAYQKAIASFAGGFLLELLDIVYAATFGVLAIYMTIFISLAYMRLKGGPDSSKTGAVSAALISFFILAGAYLPEFGTGNMGPKSMFLAILTSLGASALFLMFQRLLGRRHYLFAGGVDQEFNKMLSTFLPIALTVLIFGLANAVIIRIFDVDSFRSLMALAFNNLFKGLGSGFFTGFAFVLLSSVLWFFGIHGSDTLEGVMETYFTSKLSVNQMAVAAGGAPTEIVTKEFFDCFVLMGGCGATICLLIAILLFSRNRARRGLGYAAAFPMLFNINEMMVFGLPIIYNPIMLIPFLTVPLVCYSIAYFAISTGLVPMITSEVAWTTPIILGGFRATGSVAGSVLQIVNLAVGVLIYLPFVRMLDLQTAENARQSYDSFMDFFKKNEQELAVGSLLERGDVHSDFAKGLCAELRDGLNKGVVLYYQPQYHYDGRCIGVEALLRWNHPTYGMLYPPLVIKLAEDGGFLSRLENMVLDQAFEDSPRVFEKFGPDVKISVNVTGGTIITPEYLEHCKQLNSGRGAAGLSICVEVTEQSALALDDATLDLLRSLHSMGFQLAIDDFSMGQTSLHYLKNNLFDIIKLDGSLVRSVATNQNCREIISSITQLSDSLGLTVLAEFVENENQREILHSIGCNCYQGYLYSPAVPLEK